MLYKPWTVTTSLLLTGVLVGCNSTGRFSRDQYASLAADPFLAAPADAGGADTSAVRTANATNESFEDFPVTTTAGESSGAARSVAAPKPRPPRPSATPPESHAASTDFGSSLDAGRAGSPVVRAPETGKAAAAEAASEFDAWLNQNNQQVVQASAELTEKASRAAQKIQPAVFSGFPGEKPSFNDLIEKSEAADLQENPFARQDNPVGQQENPFAEQQNPFAEQDAAAADDLWTETDPLPFDEDDAWSPPQGFEFQ